MTDVMLRVVTATINIAIIKITPKIIGRSFPIEVETAVVVVVVVVVVDKVEKLDEPAQVIPPPLPVLSA